jgi:hypothetical protein
LTNNKVSPKISEEECLYFFPNSIISAHRFEHLANIEDCGVWRKDNSYWQSGTYMFSFELLGEESPIHFIELSDGNYVLWPNPKITWGNIATDNLPMLCVEK